MKKEKKKLIIRHLYHSIVTEIFPRMTLKFREVK